jgi:CheY-like chemotaxis protein
MMLSSAMETGGSARASELGVRSVLTKPVIQSELLDAILVSLSSNELVALHQEPGPTAIRTESGDASLHILVAEDNAINRAVISGLLGRQGHSVIHAGNGETAIEAMKQERFDLVFMDIQMPELDGLEATIRIRQMEQLSGDHIPIVAMTAHAMAGDRERCLAAGMDDYIAKPIRLEDLQRVLGEVEPRMPAQKPHAPTATVHDRAELLEMFDGDEELLGELIALFRSDTPQLLEVVRTAAGERDGPALAAGAHKLLSSLGAFGAMRACGIVKQLEQRAGRGELDDAEERVAEIEREIDVIHGCLARYAPSGAAAMVMPFNSARDAHVAV